MTFTTVLTQVAVDTVHASGVELRLLEQKAVAAGPWRARASVVSRLLAAHALVVDQVAAAIDMSRSDVWIVDTGHADWRAHFPAPVAASLAASTQGRWAELHARSRLRVADPVVEVAWITRLADGLPEGCSCRLHWAEYLQSSRPAIDTPDDYEAWAVAAHNAVNRRLGKPEYTLVESRAANPIALRMTDSGGSSSSDGDSGGDSGYSTVQI